MTLFTLAEIATALNLPSQPEWQNIYVSGVSIDTRTLQVGDVFVALSGTPGGGFYSSFASNGDGHGFMELAAQKGAVAAIVSVPNPAINIPQLVVTETHMEGLWKIGQCARARYTGHVVALTGSAGKSTTKEFLAAMLTEVAPTHASIGSYNNFWGVPLTLARMDPTSQFAVLEMGMNQKGEMARLAALGNPHVALVVNVAPVHLEHLGSLDAIRHEKLAVAEGLVSGGTLVLPFGLSTEGADLSRVGRTITFAATEEKAADVAVVGCVPQGTAWQVEARIGTQTLTFALADGAPHRLHNAMAALAVCLALGVNLHKAVSALAHVGTMGGRGAATTVNGITVLDDSFNGNPASMAASLQALKARPVQGRRIAFVGDMLELGPDAPKYHAALAAECKGLSGVVCVGPLMKNLYDALPENVRLAYVASPDDAHPAELAKLLKAGDTVVVKGSKKMFYVRGFVPKLITALRG